MADPEGNALVKCVEGFLAEKEAMAAKERKLVEDLNAVLGKMGYQVIPAKGGGGTAASAKKRGRPPGSGKGEAPKAAAS